LLHIENRDYKADILKILAQEGEIIGFNTLKEMGSFHPNRLKAHLDELEKSGDVAINRTRREFVYSYIAPRIEENYHKLTQDLRDVERSLKNPELKPDEKILLLSNFVKLAFYHQDTLRIFSLWPEGTEFTKQQYKIIEKFQGDLARDLKTKLSQLSDVEKARVLNVILSNYKEKPHLLSLSRYREITHKPTAKEKREQKLATELYLQKEYEKRDSKCLLCNEKMPKNYKDGDKHMEQHLDQLERHVEDIPLLFKQLGKIRKKQKKLKK